MPMDMADARREFLKKTDTFAIIAFGAFFGAVIVFVVAVWAMRNDRLCIPLTDLTERCVVVEQRERPTR